MLTDKPDYTSYTLDQLLDVKRQIDGHQYPERLAEVELLIRDRQKANSRRTDLPTRKDPTPPAPKQISKPGKMAVMASGVSEFITVGLLLAAWFYVLDDESRASDSFLAVGILILVSTMLSGFYKLGKAYWLHKREKSESRQVSRPDNRPEIKTPAQSDKHRDRRQKSGKKEKPAPTIERL